MTVRQITTLFLLIYTSVVQCELSNVTIGIVKDSYSPSLERIEKMVKIEVQDLLGGEFDVAFYEKDELLGDWSPEGVRSAVEKAVTNDSIDMVIGLGPLACNELCHIQSYPKPVFAPFIMNIQMQQLPIANGTSGVDNLNYIAFPTNLERDVLTFHEIVAFSQLTFLVNGYVYEAIPGLEEIIRDIVQDAGVKVDVIPVWNSAEDALNRLPPNTEAVYVVSLTQLESEELNKLAEGLIARDLPSFSLFKERYLNNGFLASMSPDSDLPRLIRRLALNIQRVLLGENAGDLSVYVPESDQLAINMKTAKEIGVSPPWHIMNDAVLIEAEHKHACMELSLRDAVDFGVVRNPGLAASGKIIDIGCQQVNKARSRLYPHLKVAGSYTHIDKDRAENTFGVFPEKAIWGRAGMSQMIYNNEFIGDYRVEKQLQKSRCYGYQVDKLDLIQGVAESYLNLLRAQTLERIQRNNLDRTRAHLKLARQRVNVGVALSSEVYRWESQYASDLTKVTHASFRTKSAETNLKQLINIPQDTCLQIREVTLDEPYWTKKKSWLEDNVTNDHALEVFIEFSVIEALQKSDEIKKLRSDIVAQCEVLGIAQRAFWTPDISFDVLASQRANEWGAGTTGPALFNRTDWMLGLNLSFPLYTGGYKTAAKRQACHELKRLKLILDNQVNIEKENVRISAYNAVSSYSAISLSEQSAKTAQSNLSLVQDSYSKGVVQIVDLLDAQNQALMADLVTANAIYDFLIDLVYFQRQVHQFDFLVDPTDADEWIKNIDHYYNLRLKGDRRR